MNYSDDNIEDAEIVSPELAISAPLPPPPLADGIETDLDEAEREAARQLGRPWPAGQSGNPRGRPPNKLSLTAAIKARLGDVCEEDRAGAEKEGRPVRTWLEVIRDAALISAAKGNEKALALVFDRVDGKAASKVVHEGEINHTGNVKHNHEHALAVRDAVVGRLEEMRGKLIEARSGGAK